MQKVNTNRKIAAIFLILTSIFGIGIFIPPIFGIDGFDGGFAFSVLSLFFCLFTMVSTFIFYELGKIQDKIKNGDKLLAHWKYSNSEWHIFVEEEIEKSTIEKKMLLLITAGFATCVGILAPLFDVKNGIIVTCIMGGLIILIGSIAWLSIIFTKRELHQNKKEVWLGKNGIILGGKLYAWNFLGNKLTSANLYESKKGKYIVITAIDGNNEYTVRIPIPTGKAFEAEKIVEKLSKG
ncbi:hypothetical protein A2X44_02365 [candidate division CPR3 bacterium GWF2_35_18]|uniref:Uncharacterized protein n=1 Tax=candidate division CPR3 bacterium GW2011_GWF2_35_18 TaxID=1618350 RepID=A0A0G0C1Q9_UNCC3|nr:MAG: hypothetical protein UR67_C0002G0156 [candidate division CPR3 bacterium GW2011_GWF2_35_18]OGB62839.1 MAG: hypothetical protein A2X44_02365 [candidate division CPR3 bacterium GWF2_35_18]OGB65420.1 MAG: hypothetical protein A2250_00580 [candidate division CPR3 bacterium RIFOXYA2_FULL_35_13]OGB76841.1 MAG: hypothetical protein A2476_04175 [candidate division CPR3 bacterium RIFOXYC2_FULL_35_7]